MLFEFSGTPSSGKSSVLKNIQSGDLFKTVNIVDESIKECPFGDDQFELGVLWSTFKTFEEFQFTISKNLEPDHQIFFDRGLFDRVAFVRLLSIEENMFLPYCLKIEDLIFNSGYLNKLDKIFMFVTPFQKAFLRKNKYKKNNKSRYRFVNEATIMRLNSIYYDLYSEYKNKLPFVLIDDTENNISLKQKTLSVIRNLPDTQVL